MISFNNNLGGKTKYNKKNGQLTIYINSNSFTIECN